MKIVLERKVVFWFIKFVGKNGKTLMHSETYYSKSNALRAGRKISKALNIKFEEE